jgi:hypothetical protein
MSFLAPSCRAFNLGYLKYPETWLHRYALEELHFQLSVHKKGTERALPPPRDEVSVAPSCRAFNMEYLKYPVAWLYHYVLKELHFQFYKSKKAQKKLCLSTTR